MYIVKFNNLIICFGVIETQMQGAKSTHIYDITLPISYTTYCQVVDGHTCKDSNFNHVSSINVVDFSNVCFDIYQMGSTTAGYYIHYIVIGY